MTSTTFNLSLKFSKKVKTIIIVNAQFSNNTVNNDKVVRLIHKIHNISY